jgi:hypothetical protein
MTNLKEKLFSNINKNSYIFMSTGIIINNSTLNFLIVFIIIDTIILIIILYNYSTIKFYLLSLLSPLKNNDYIKGAIDVNNKSFLPKLFDNIHNNKFIKFIRILGGISVIIFLLLSKYNININE